MTWKVLLTETTCKLRLTSLEYGSAENVRPVKILSDKNASFHPYKTQMKRSVFCLITRFNMDIGLENLKLLLQQFLNLIGDVMTFFDC